MGVGQAVRTCLGKYVDFSGRAVRSEFWLFMLFLLAIGIVGGIVDAMLFPGIQPMGPLAIVTNLGLFLPSLAVGTRRLHDTGRSGWWQLIILVPLIGIIVLIVWWCTAGGRDDNAHGPAPVIA